MRFPQFSAQYLERLNKDSVIASEIANEYIKQLEDFLSRKQLTTTQKSRKFIDSQLQKTETHLAEAEKALKNFRSCTF